MTKLVTMTTKSQYQCECSECHCDIWHTGERYLHCPHCGKKLNECSSEDASDGVFLPPHGSLKWAVRQMQEGKKVCHPEVNMLGGHFYLEENRVHWFSIYGMSSHTMEHWLSMYEHEYQDGWEIYRGGEE